MENIKKDVNLLQFGVKNLNNRVYSEHETTFSESGPVTSVPDDKSFIGFYSNARVENGYLVCDVTLLDKNFAGLMQADVVDFASAGVGEVDKDGTVSNYTMKSVFVVPKGSKA